MKSQGCVTEMLKKYSENVLEITELGIFFIFVFERHFCFQMLTSFKEIT